MNAILFAHITRDKGASMCAGPLGLGVYERSDDMQATRGISYRTPLSQQYLQTAPATGLEGGSVPLHTDRSLSLLTEWGNPPVRSSDFLTCQAVLSVTVVVVVLYVLLCLCCVAISPLSSIDTRGTIGLLRFGLPCYSHKYLENMSHRKLCSEGTNRSMI